MRVRANESHTIPIFTPVLGDWYFALKFKVRTSSIVRTGKVTSPQRFTPVIRYESQHRQIDSDSAFATRFVPESSRRSKAKKAALHQHCCIDSSQRPNRALSYAPASRNHLTSIHRTTRPLDASNAKE